MRRSRTLAVQRLISGQVLDDRTGEPPRAPVEVSLRDRDADGRPYPLRRAVTGDRRFSFSGDPRTAFPALAQRPYHLRVEADAERYASTAVDVDLPVVPGQPAPVEVEVPIASPATVLLFTGGGLPVAGLTLRLAPEPVRLRGRVVVSNDPRRGVPGAGVQIVGGPSSTTAGDGRFAFPAPLPLEDVVDLVVTAADFHPRELTHELDYEQPVNTLTVPLRRA